MSSPKWLETNSNLDPALPVPSSPLEEGPKRFPLAYWFVVGLFLVSGLVWFISACYSDYSLFDIPPGIVCIVTGVGLLLRKPALWTVSLFLLWVEFAWLCFRALIEGFVLVALGSWVGLIGYLAVLMVKFLLCIWAYRVLISTAVCRCYYESGADAE